MGPTGADAGIEVVVSSAPPLRDVRVLDLAGPIGAYCVRLLADLGAEVVVVERPEGDRLRRIPPFAGDDEGNPLLFAYYHASTRSVVVGPDDVNQLEHLAAGADVILISPLDVPVPGWDATRGIMAGAAQAIVCSITPFGLTGPWRNWRSTPMISFALGGGMYRAGRPEGPPLTLPGRQQWDEAGAHAAFSILAALQALPAVGPQLIDLSVHETAIGKEFMIEQYAVAGLNTLGRSLPVGLPPTGTYQCIDGAMDIAAHQPRHWPAFLKMLDNPDELREPSLADPMIRRALFDGVEQVIRRLLSSRSREDLVERGQAAGLPCGLMHTPSEFLADSQTQAREVVTPQQTPFGTVPMPGPGYRSVPSLTAPRTPAPTLDADRGYRWDGSASRSTTTTGARSAALEGVRILSFGMFVAGNSIAGMLAELGADVVKIEARAHPEPLRGAAYALGGPVVNEPSGVTNTVMEACLSRSVRNLSVDMTSNEGQQIVRRLARVTDVVIENFGGGVMARWGCSYDDLRAINARLVMTSISGYGRSGPRADYLAYGSNMCNFTGLTHAWGYTSGMQTDYITGAHAAVVTLAALRHARATGMGAHIDSSQIEAMAAVMPDVILDAAVNRRDGGIRGNNIPGSVFSGVYPCVGHDAWVAVEAEELADWSKLCLAVGADGLDAKTAAEAAELRDALDATIAAWAQDKTAHTAAHRLQAAGVAAGAVQNNEDLWRDPQLRSRGAIVELDQPDLGTYQYTQSPHRLSLTPGRGRWAGPRLGQHTVEVLREWLALDAFDLDQLLESNVVVQG